MEAIRDDLRAIGMDVAAIESNLSRFEKSQIGEAMSLLKVLSANDPSAHMASLHIDLKALGLSLQDSANDIKMGVARLVERIRQVPSSIPSTALYYVTYCVQI